MLFPVTWLQSSEESLRALAQHCVTLADVAEDVAAALDHKNPKGEAGSELGQRLHELLMSSSHSNEASTTREPLPLPCPQIGKASGEENR